jgi:hypothetical protein
VFELERDLQNKSLLLNGYVYNGTNDREPLDNKGGRKIPFRECCKDDDAFRIRAEVEGNEFKFWVTVENIKYVKEGKRIDVVKEERLDTGIEYFVESFKDNRSLFPYGNVGLFEPDGSQMKVESMVISSPAGK